MACPHSESCPLFPRLQASLAGWRRNYCDTADTWQTCARYDRSLSGKSVPLTLLPNGHEIQLVEAQPTPTPASTATALADWDDDQANAVPTSFFKRLFGKKS